MPNFTARVCPIHKAPKVVSASAIFPVFNSGASYMKLK